MTENTEVKDGASVNEAENQNTDNQKPDEASTAKVSERKEETKSDVKPDTNKVALASDVKDKSEEKKSYTQEEVEKIVDDKISSLKNELEKRDRADLIKSKGVNEKFAQFVEFEVQKSTDDKADFAKALDGFIEKNPWVCETKPTGISMSGNSESLSGVEKAFYEKNPKLKN